MGISKGAIRHIARTFKTPPDPFRVVTLGRQAVFATLDEVKRILREEGVEPSSGIQATPGLADATYSNSISDITLFQLMGAETVDAIDIVGDEGANHVYDLNYPLPKALTQRYDLVFDGGTIEHVFDIRMALQNVAELARSGGRVIHMSPCNNYANHGFFQLSPTLFVDFYGTNGFDDIEVLVAEEHHLGADHIQFRLFDCTRTQPALIMSRRRLSVFAAATRVSSSTSTRVPQQGIYRSDHAPLVAQPTPRPHRTIRGLARRILGRRMSDFLRARLLSWFHRRPWGLPSRGRA